MFVSLLLVLDALEANLIREHVHLDLGEGGRETDKSEVTESKKAWEKKYPYETQPRRKPLSHKHQRCTQTKLTVEPKFWTLRKHKSKVTIQFSNEQRHTITTTR